MATTSEPRVHTGKDYDIAETIIVPPCPKPGVKPRGHKSIRHSARHHPAVVPVANDPKEIVRKFWHGSFSVSRKRKLTQTKSRIRQQLLLSEELQRLENETLLWREALSELSG